MKKGVTKNFGNFTGKHLCLSLVTTRQRNYKLNVKKVFIGLVEFGFFKDKVMKTKGKQIEIEISNTKNKLAKYLRTYRSRFFTS